jgi:hypothetical protein
MGEVEVPSGEHQRDAGDDQERALGGRRDRQPIGVQHDEDETRCLHQDGGQRDSETGTPGRHRRLWQARAPHSQAAEPGAP